jgi:methyltransferase
MRPSHQEYLMPGWVRFTLTIPGQNYIDAHIGLFLASAALEVILFNRSFPGALEWLALALALLAQALRYWCAVTLGENWNTRIIVWPARELVITGPYRFIRHPNYLAVMVEIASVPLIHGCWLTAMVFSVGNAWLLRSRIRAEETALGLAYRMVFAEHPRG